MQDPTFSDYLAAMMIAEAHTAQGKNRAETVRNQCDMAEAILDCADQYVNAPIACPEHETIERDAKGRLSVNFTQDNAK